MQRKTLTFEPLHLSGGNWPASGNTPGYGPSRWAREGRVPHMRLGRRIKFRVSDLNSWSGRLYTGNAVRAAQP